MKSWIRHCVELEKLSDSSNNDYMTLYTTRSNNFSWNNYALLRSRLPVASIVLYTYVGIDCTIL